jgi:hypothetical protein
VRARKECVWNYLPSFAIHMRIVSTSRIPGILCAGKHISKHAPVAQHHTQDTCIGPYGSCSRLCGLLRGSHTDT